MPLVIKVKVQSSKNILKIVKKSIKAYLKSYTACKFEPIVYMSSKFLLTM